MYKGSLQPEGALFCTILDVSRSFLAHVEQGERSFSSYKLKLLADVLQVSMDSIYCGPSEETVGKEIMKKLED